MNRHLILALVITGLAMGGVANDAIAAPPWQSLIPFKKRVEADPNKDYLLTESHGPWMILAATFTSNDAVEEAHELALEIRERYNLPAYVHRQDFDFTSPVAGRGYDKYGQPKRMRYANASRFTGAAVLVGDFETYEDSNGQKALELLKRAVPESLDAESGRWTLNRWKVYQDIRRRLNVNDERNEKGPLGGSFITRNPMLPEEYFTGGGLDPFVAKMNDGVKHSLLSNPGKYTVQVATFGGETSTDPKVIEQLSRSRNVTDKLAQAADQAHRLTEALRRRGVEAYEFHDRFASLVTVGSFDSHEQSLPDGTKQQRADIRQIIVEYGAKAANIPGQSTVGVVPKELEGIKFDATPTLVEVPRKSIGAAYARTGDR